MLSNSAKVLTILVAVISVLAATAVVYSGSADADTEETYQFCLTTSIEGCNDSICGWHTAKGTSPVAAFCKMLDDEKITYTGFSGSDASVYFGDEKYFSDWVATWGANVDDYGINYGANFCIWNYNSTDGWFMGNTFGSDKDTVYLISYEKFYDLDSQAATDAGIVNTDVWGDPVDYNLQYTGTTYTDATQALQMWYKATYMEGDLADYGISLIDPDDEDYDDADYAAMMWAATYDANKYSYGNLVGATVEEYGLQLGTAYFHNIPVNDAAKPEDLVYGAYYQFALDCQVDGQDATYNGWYGAYGTSVVNAFVHALDNASVPYSGFTSSDASISFGNNSISTWTKAWDSTATDLIGANYGIWNYNPYDGWYLGNTFGTDSDRVYIISLANFYKVDGATAQSMAVSTSTEGTVCTPAGLTAPWGSWVQSAPRDYMANPANVVLGLDQSSLAEYTFILSNTVASTATLNTYTGTGNTPVNALANALNNASISYTFDFSADSVFFSSYGDGIISDWVDSWDSTATDVIGANYAIWNYNSTDGWFTGNSFGMDDETTYYISYENYYKLTGATAQSWGILMNSDGDVYIPEQGLVDTYASWIQLAPRDASATPANVVFGPDLTNLASYTFILSNTVASTPALNTYTASGTTPVNALAGALFAAGISYTFDKDAASVYFSAGEYGGGIISDWVDSWDSSATDLIGANYAIWQYNADDGWFMGNSFGMDEETIYYISYENYYKPTGTTAKTMGITVSTEGAVCIPIKGVIDSWGSWIQSAPRDASATPANVVFGADTSGLVTYTFILVNSVADANSDVNDTYTALGTTPVNALGNALNTAGIAYTFDYNAESVYFSSADGGQGIIDDWETAWDSSATDLIGANYAIWNYNADDGWFMGNSFGTDSDTTYLISHENYYKPTGASAAAMGVTVDEDGKITVPEGLYNSWDSWIQLAPMDCSATPENLEFKVFYFITYILNNGEDDLKAAGYEGTAVTAPADPTKTGCTFYKWDPAVPSTFTELALDIEAVWKVTPVETETTVEVDLSSGDSNFDMPTTTKTVNVALANSSSVSIADTTNLAGKTVTAAIEPVENPTDLEGTAYEFTFEANGSEYNGTIQVTVPYDGSSGKAPVVYFVDSNGDKAAMKVVSYTSTSVTFETDHNSTYVVSTDTSAAPINFMLIAACALLIALLIVGIVVGNGTRKYKA